MDVYGYLTILQIRLQPYAINARTDKSIYTRKKEKIIIS